MKVLSISTDKKIFEDNSAVLERQKEYASKLDELHIIIFTERGFRKRQIGNLYIYPTNSFSKLKYISDAGNIAGDILKNNSDFVVTTQDPFETGLVGLRLKRKFKTPLQIQIHTDFLDNHFKNSILNRIRVFLSKSVLQNADGIRVVSSVIKDSLIKKYPEISSKIDILPIFVDIEKFQRNNENFYDQEKVKNSILMVSRLSSEKRIDIALLSLKKIIDSGYEDVRLKIVGSGPEKQNIENLITKNGLTNNVEMVDWDNNVINEYKKHKIFFLTSEFEGYGMALIEAGALGLSIVTTRVGIAKTDLFKDSVNSFVCPVGDIECLSSSIIRLLDDTEKSKSFSKRIMEDIRSSSITKNEYLERYISLLKKIK